MIPTDGSWITETRTQLETENSSSSSSIVGGGDEGDWARRRKGDGGHIGSRATDLPSPNKATESPRPTTRLPSVTLPGFRVIKRSRRTLKLPPPLPPTKRRLLRPTLLRAHLSDRYRAIVKQTKTEVTRSRSAVLHKDTDGDAVVPRCFEYEDVSSTQAAAAAAAGAAASDDVILSVPRASTDATSQRHSTHEHHHQPKLEASQGRQQQQLQQQPALSADGVPNHPLINIPVPTDPRLWSRLDVRSWLDHVRRLYSIRDLDLDRFQMNGKALCIMTPAMFLFRVPEGGTSLFCDFQMRLRRALEL